MNYTVTLTDKSAVMDTHPDLYLHFARLTFDIVWNPETGRQDVVYGVDKFFGGNCGEGSTFENWQDAIHTSLYDAFQTSEELQDGDTITVKFGRQTAQFLCSGVHVVKA